ncbi:MAG TPA: ABC transporter ATP-binding protein [Nannocystis sp.]
MRPPASLEIAALSHRYPGAAVPALAQVGFRVAPGERVGLLGPNGAGKSTLMRLLCGYLPVQRVPGTRVRVGEVEVAADSLRARQLVGYLPEQVPLYPELRVREHLDFRASIKGVRRKARPPEILRVAERTGLSHMLEVPIQQLSRGYRQRVGIADALLGAPPLVVLDEPTVGLDPNQVLEIRAMLRALGGTQTLIFSSHILAEVEALCDRVVILAGGKCVADEAVAEALRGSDVIVAWMIAQADAEIVLASALRDMSAGTGDLTTLADGLGLRLGSFEARGDAAQLRITCPDAQVAEALARAIGRASAAAGVALARLELGRGRLEERFARVTGAVAGA